MARAWIADLLRRGTLQLGLSVAVGLGAFLLAYLVLGSLKAGTAPVDVPAARTPPGIDPVPDSFASRIAAGKVAIGAPASPMPADVRAGDRLDVIALLPGGPGQPALAAVVVRGAVVLQPGGGGRTPPLILEVAPEEAVALTHVLQARMQISYALWPTNGAPPVARPMDAEAVRARLALPTAAPATVPLVR